MVNANQKQDLEKELEGKLSDIGLEKQKEEAVRLAEKSGLPSLSLTGYPIDMRVAGLLEEVDAIRGQLMPIAKSGNKLTIALTNPENDRTVEVLKKVEEKGYQYSLVIVSPHELQKALERYGEIRKTDQINLGTVNIKAEELTELQKQIESIADLKERLTEMPVSKVLNILLAGALKVEASDIHFENEEGGIRLRYRVDGVLVDVVDFSTTGFSQLINRVKLMSGLKINVHDKPQDGRFTIHHDETTVEVRVSIIPSAYGENIVLRILDPKTIKQNLEDLGMREDTLALVKKLLKKTTGSIITTGPTGSGKTTTLYAFLKYINNPEIKVITIEDPIEYHLEGITQTQANSHAGYDFASALRSIVRQDPDVILVGEMRDAETAGIAMQAALTGHLVFSTLHTNNAAGAIPRLIDLGVKPITIAPAINAAMAQRLVRRLCQKCKKGSQIKKEDFEIIKNSFTGLKLENLDINEQTIIYSPSGCNECNNTGYKGRIGIYEIFEIDPEIEKLIQQSPAISDVENLATKKGMVTMLQDGFIKVLNGITSIEEILRVAG